MNKRNILVTATGGRSVGSGIVHALMNGPDQLMRWNVVATDADPFAWGLYKAGQSHLLPPAKDAGYLSALLNVVSKQNIHAILPGSEAETTFLALHAAEVPVPVICNRPELMPLMMDKFAMISRLQELGLPTIETFPIANWKDAVNRHDFPFIVKPTVGTGGSKGLHFVFTESELAILLPTLQEESKYCIQPYIGTGDDEYTVGVLSDMQGRLIDSIVMRRKLIGLSLLQSRKLNNKEYGISTGYSQGFIIKDAAIQDFCESLARKLDSRGPLNIQLRKKGNEIFVFEIHPRFSGTSPIRADVGFNEADVLLRNALDGEKFQRLDYRYNVAAIRAFTHVIVDMNNMLTK